MTIISRNAQERPVLARTRLRALVDVARRRMGAPPGVVGFLFVDDAAMAALHERYSGDASTTDVLSFPDIDADGDGPSGHRRGEPAYWGDVIICTDQALRQARALRHPYPYELVVLALHGVLHLLGFDHARDAGDMSRLEETLRPLAATGFACR